MSSSIARKAKTMSEHSMIRVSSRAPMVSRRHQSLPLVESIAGRMAETCEAKCARRNLLLPATYAGYTLRRGTDQ